MTPAVPFVIRFTKTLFDSGAETLRFDIERQPTSKTKPALLFTSRYHDILCISHNSMARLCLSQCMPVLQITLKSNRGAYGYSGVYNYSRSSHDIMIAKANRLSSEYCAYCWENKVKDKHNEASI